MFMTSPFGGTTDGHGGEVPEVRVDAAAGADLQVLPDAAGRVVTGVLG
jgi:hypothetical protein